jgi:hydroxyethylthiazole kinase-like uncharacterized protein yjeF
MIITREEMLAIEKAAFDAGVSAEALMDEAGRQMARRIRRLASSGGPGTAVIFAGKGNNAGDALVVAAHLRDAAWTVGLRFADAEPGADELPGRKLAALGPFMPRWTEREAKEAAARREPGSPFIVIDGLLGVGARGPLREPIQGAARELNALRRYHGAQVFALDLPTGVDADSGYPHEDAVAADVTLTVGFAKAGLVADPAINHVGRLEIIVLPELTREAEGVLGEDPDERDFLTAPANLAPLLPPRPFETNKTRVGRVGILAGGIGTTGAALMASLGTLRAGAGLVTLLANERIYPILAAAASPEVMVKPIVSPLDALEENFDVLAVGPGLHPDEDNDELRSLIERWDKPMVVDAGALTALAQNVTLLDACAGPRLLTPHPGEMNRLWRAEASLRGKDMESLPRAEIVREFTGRYPVALLLKGSRTLVGQSERPLAYNTTGNPGMASGGMGDILTGVCAALIGQKLDAYDAGRFGAWLCGRAADLAVQGAESEPSLIATDLPRYFGAAFRELRSAAL